MASDTAIDRNKNLDEFSTDKNAAGIPEHFYIGGTKMSLDHAMWNMIDIRSETIIESETTGGGGHVKSSGGYVSGYVAPIHSRTSSYTVYTYFLENNDGRMHFSSRQQLDAIVGDKILIVTSRRAKKPKRTFIPMIYIPAYNKWEIWNHDIAEITKQSKHAKLFFVFAYFIAGVFALISPLILGIEGDASGVIGGFFVMLASLAIGLIASAGVYGLLFLPSKRALKRTLKAMQKKLV